MSLHVRATNRWIMVLACITIAAAQAPADPGSQVRAARERSNRALAMHDSRTFGESLAADFVIVRGNGVFMSHQGWIDAVETDFKNPKTVRYERIVDKIEISAVAPVAAEHGHWTDLAGREHIIVNREGKARFGEAGKQAVFQHRGRAHANLFGRLAD